ncbi:glutathione ABC transporter ATP-binding protein [Leucobacter sp. OLJS4]|uniref:dipeptide ABC transporter ATP-binding protein n=1 Tax=unclassified Leucobacter TaxID=2621730 RepID=UPI000C18286D|nr:MULTISPECIES: ABC transporter ATP-binding protein [unclassified Leucobacter]PIJ55850.1 glutathione ABC transporter ATP-binding protein [Leucobacter sp. OLES1]PII84404.1 glutathione ABC transporter ATP-binding protein [Leucobacter sp. OLCALW19]PII91001.1 glutathione ABC transporter ATP-binding protein [Leucobacter sp. OLAS13]PII95628.1 glutathione ABC transporter ATP-binding protein [Leucobacter sp. OLTLW20]PII97748.1 glutathione ABC transporter ATP-binding protein [Leucobacter sp. OLDS2]
MSATTRNGTGTVLEIQDLGVTFATDHGPVRAVDGVSLSISPGRVLAVVGESGSGKTVTARTVLGLLPETAVSQGAVVLRTRDGSGSSEILRLSDEQLREVRGRDVAMVFQEASTALNPVFTIGWQIAEGLRAHEKLSKKEARTRAIEVLGRVGIPDPEERVDYYPHQLSGGQKQRVMIAMALSLNPGLIVADEPTTALDVTVQAEILDLLRKLRDDFGTAILLITHNMGVVADLADDVAVMYQGELVEQAPVAELFANPREQYTKDLLGAVLRLGDRSIRTQAREAVPEGASASGATRGEVLVAAQGLEIQYPGRLGRPGFRAVRGVDFEIAAGEVYSLVGESGSGKSTIGRAIAGLTAATGGSLRVLGHEMVGVKERRFRAARRDIGFVFQDPGSSFNPLLTIADNVAEPLVVHRIARNPQAARKRVDELLEAVQLPRSYGDRFPHELSGGQRQRASLARGLALDPKLLIADEPTSALDVSVQARVLELFAELQRELGFASLFITHDLAVVDALADRVGVLYHGELVEVGGCAEVLGAPTHPYTQRLLASLPVPDPVEQAERREAARLAREVPGA